MQPAVSRRPSSEAGKTSTTTGKNVSVPVSDAINFIMVKENKDGNMGDSEMMDFLYDNLLSEKGKEEVLKETTDQHNEQLLRFTTWMSKS